MPTKKARAGGCDIQATGINYRIAVSTHPPLKVWSRSDDDAGQDHHLSNGGVRHVLRNVTCRVRPGELLGEECRWRNVGVMVAFMAAYRVLGYAVLRVRCSRSGGTAMAAASSKASSSSSSSVSA